jgi:hypothetical protein
MSLRRTMVLSSVVCTLLALGAACGDDAEGTGASGTGANGEGGGGDKEEQTLENALDTMSLTADKVWRLKGVVTVPAGKTLTIEPGTTIVGDKGSLGTLVVQRGGKIMAEGTADKPIVFTSGLPKGQRGAGDWGGVVILGKAPINEASGEAEVEGFSDPQMFGGGASPDPNDNSGSLKYVRIEFGGIEIATDNEINGLTLAGVGKGTKIDFIQVKNTLDDCFEFFGGTVDAKHLVCYNNQDDGLDFDSGYTGAIQFYFHRSDPAIADDANGLECDNDEEDPGVTPITNPTISNITLCGPNADPPKQQYGFLFRRGFHANVKNAFVTGFEAGVDFRNTPATQVTLSNSVFSGNEVHNVAYPETDPSTDMKLPNEDDDDGFDEIGWFTEGTGNSETGAIGDCWAATPDPAPASTIPGGAPSGSGFDTAASYVGAFKDKSDTWMTGAWVDWSNN